MPRFTPWVLPVLIGGLAGFIGLWMREPGQVLAAAVVVVMSAVYAVRRRWVDIGLLLCAAGIVPGAILGRNILTAVTDPAVAVHDDTYVLFGVALAMLIGGLLVLVASGVVAWLREHSRQP